MSEEKFQKQYAKAYKDIKDIPEHLRVRYGIDENMTREQSIKIIRILDKKKLYELLNSIPDVVIAGKFKEDLSKRKQKLEGKNSDIISQIGQAWNNIVKKMSDED